MSSMSAAGSRAVTRGPPVPACYQCENFRKPLEFSKQSWWRSVGLLGELLWLLLRCDSVDALFERAGPARSAPPGVSGGREAHQALALAKGGAPSSQDFMEKCLGAETRCSGPVALETELWHSWWFKPPPPANP